MNKIFILLLLIFLISPYTVSAHSGRTDSSGGHNCRVGSCAGTYHYHNGGSAPAPVQETVQVFTLPTNTPIPTAIPTKVPTKIPTSTPTPTITVIPTNTPIQQIEVESTQKTTQSKNSFFSWFFSLFAM